MVGCVLLTQTLLFAVTATVVLPLLVTHGFFSPSSQYVVTLPFPLKVTKKKRGFVL
jgi:hypothetical protein